jgi:hypothetical protein
MSIPGQAGWGRPFRWYNDADVGYGRSIAVRLPSQMRNSTGFVALTLSGLNSVLYLSARINTPPFDLPFPVSENGVPFVLLHSYRGNPSYAYVSTILRGKGRVGEGFVENSTGLVVRFLAWTLPANAGNDMTAGEASVLVCRRNGTTEQRCDDGLDDDCDGLTDDQDPDCIGRNAVPPAPRLLQVPPSPMSKAPRRRPSGRPTATSNGKPSAPLAHLTVPPRPPSTLPPAPKAVLLLPASPSPRVVLSSPPWPSPPPLPSAAMTSPRPPSPQPTIQPLPQLVKPPSRPPSSPFSSPPKNPSSPPAMRPPPIGTKATRPPPSSTLPDRGAAPPPLSTGKRRQPPGGRSHSSKPSSG